MAKNIMKIGLWITGFLVACLIVAPLAAQQGATGASGQWVTKGFEEFRQGTFGNAGQNLYVSKAGVLQRIFQFDLNHDGYLDILYCNSQDHWEQADAYVYSDVLGTPTRRAIPSDGAESGAIFDLNRDGYDDLVLAMRDNGTRPDLNSFVYYGDVTGLSERRMLRLPTPAARSVVAGDFNGDRLPDLAFALDSGLRLFYQGPLGFEAKRFVDVDVTVDQLTSSDLDEDGFADLVARDRQGHLSLYWGNPQGILARIRLEVTVGADGTQTAGRTPAEGGPQEPVVPRAGYLKIGQRGYLSVPREDRFFLIPLDKSRELGASMIIQQPAVLSSAIGDINGNGLPDLVLVTHDDQSWVYWDLDTGLHERTRTRLATSFARDVEVTDLNDDHCDEVIVCQDRTSESYTFHSLVFQGNRDGLAAKPVELESLEARRVLVGRTSGKGPELIFVNRMARDAGGHVNAYVYWGGADGFKPDGRLELSARGAIGGIPGDFNDDGLADLLLANCSENSVGLDPGSFVFFGKPDGFAYEPSIKLPTRRAHGLSCADINRDGYLDFVLVGFSNPDLLVFYGSASGYSEARSSRIRMEMDGQLYNDPRWLHLADFNRDGWLDLVVPQISFDRSFILWGSPEGFSLERRQMLSVWHGSYVNSADLDGNGWLDLVIGGHIPSRTSPHDSFVHIYWNGPDGLREDRRTQLPANGVNAVGIRDLNNDRWLDLVVSNYHDNRFRDIDSFIYWGSPDGFSASRMFRLPAHSASGTILNDFNEDGWVDIAIAHHKTDGDHKGTSAVWWNGPKGFSPDRITRLPTNGPHGMIVIDPGNQQDRAEEEYYVSKPFELPLNARVTAIRWKGETPAKTWVRTEFRLAPSSQGLQQAEWKQADALASSRLATGNQTWVQYRLALGAKGGGRTPRISEVTVSFTQAPSAATSLR